MNLTDALKSKYELLFPHLTQRQRQLVAAADAETLGRGKVALVARLAGFSRPTLYRALEDIHRSPQPEERSRPATAGRKKRVDENPALLQALEALIEPNVRDDPTSLLRWTCVGSRELARCLAERGHVVSHELVAQLLRQLGYRSQAAGPRHPQRAAQFRYVQGQAQAFSTAGLPVVAVFGRLGEAENGRANDSPVEPAAERETPVAPPSPASSAEAGPGSIRRGRVEARDEARFLVEGLRCWWDGPGQQYSGPAGRLLICADAIQGRSGRTNWWLLELRRWLEETGLEVTVCHLPAGTLKWRWLVNQVTTQVSTRQSNAAPLVYQAVVSLVGAAPEGAPPVRRAAAAPTTEEVLTALELSPHPYHGHWNYTVKGKASRGPSGPG